MRTKEIRLKYRIEETDEVQDFLGKLFDRQAEQALLKTWKKVFGGETEEELKARNIVIQDPSVWFEIDGLTGRIATSESDGRETEVGSDDEDSSDSPPDMGSVGNLGEID